MDDKKKSKQINRRDLLTGGIRGAGLLGLGAAAGALGGRAAEGQMVWQLDPHKCISCGQCATYCVLDESAVKCVHTYAMCGYCNLCTGYYEPNAQELDTGAENQLCPTGALIRTFIEDPYYQYTVDEPLCIGCGKCVKGCNAFGNGSLYLQVCHDRCVNCNECSIAVACPAGAFKRVPAENPYMVKEVGHSK
ncbi:MAG: ferredoxin [Phycisphaerae bacterium]|nr:ferredoxin [Phycisphaerae bacterium]